MSEEYCCPGFLLYRCCKLSQTCSPLMKHRKSRSGLKERVSQSSLVQLEKSGASYSVLYASDPTRSKPSSSYRSLDRFLAEGNGSLYSESYCDGVCNIKSSLLEGLLVGIVLLIILIFGLCCMMGIDTPTRFEAPQD